MKESLEINIDIELEKARDGAWVASIPASNSAYWSASAANSAAKSVADSAAYSAYSAANSAYWTVAERLKQVEMIKEALSERDLRD